MSATYTRDDEEEKLLASMKQELESINDEALSVLNELMTLIPGITNEKGREEAEATAENASVYFEAMKYMLGYIGKSWDDEVIEVVKDFEGNSIVMDTFIQNISTSGATEPATTRRRVMLRITYDGKVYRGDKKGYRSDKRIYKIYLSDRNLVFKTVDSKVFSDDDAVLYGAISAAVMLIKMLFIDVLTEMSALNMGVQSNAEFIKMVCEIVRNDLISKNQETGARDIIKGGGGLDFSNGIKSVKVKAMSLLKEMKSDFERLKLSKVVAIDRQTVKAAQNVRRNMSFKAKEKEHVKTYKNRPEEFLRLLENAKAQVENTALGKSSGEGIHAYITALSIAIEAFLRGDGGKELDDYRVDRDGKTLAKILHNPKSETVQIDVMYLLERMGFDLADMKASNIKKLIKDVRNSLLFLTRQPVFYDVELGNMKAGSSGTLFSMKYAELNTGDYLDMDESDEVGDAEMSGQWVFILTDRIYNCRKGGFKMPFDSFNHDSGVLLFSRLPRPTASALFKSLFLAWSEVGFNDTTEKRLKDGRLVNPEYGELETTFAAIGLSLDDYKYPDYVFEVFCEAAELGGIVVTREGKSKIKIINTHTKKRAGLLS